MAASAEPLDVYWSNGEVRLHGLDWGGGEGATPMVLLHGVGGNAWVWNALAPRLRAELGDDYRIVGLDQRGHGDSDKPESGYSADDFGQDVLAVHQALGADKPMVLVGHSRGGWLSSYVASRWPERVRCLVLIDPARITFTSSGDADEFYRPVRGALGPFPSKEAAIAFARQQDPEARWTAERERTFLFGYERRPDGSLVGKIPPPVVDRLREAREAGAAVKTLLHRASMPVLLMVATRASETRRQQKLEYARYLPHVRVEHVEGTHYLHLDDPERVAELIVEFLSLERRP